MLNICGRGMIIFEDGDHDDPKRVHSVETVITIICGKVGYDVLHQGTPALLNVGALA